MYLSVGLSMCNAYLDVSKVKSLHLDEHNVPMRLYMLICLCVSVSICLWVCVSMCVSVYLPKCRPICTMCLYLSICMCLFVYPSICHYLYKSKSLCSICVIWEKQCAYECYVAMCIVNLSNCLYVSTYLYICLRDINNFE